MINKLILGTVQFGLPYGINNTIGQPKESDVFKILDYAFEQGINVLDSANAYGSSLNIISSYHRAHKNKFNLISKFHVNNNSIIDSCNDELNKLGIDRFEGYLFHSFDDYVSCDNTIYNQLLKLKKENKLKKIGVSIYTNEQFEKVIYDENIDLIQFPFNMLDNNYQRGVLIIKAKAMGKELHSRSVFLQGLFFKEAKALPVLLTPLIKYLEKINEIALSFHYSIQQIALSYVLQNSMIDKVLFGVDSLQQLIINIDEALVKINPLCIEAINQIQVKEVELLNPANWIQKY